MIVGDVHNTPLGDPPKIFNGFSLWISLVLDDLDSIYFLQPLAEHQYALV